MPEIKANILQDNVKVNVIQHVIKATIKDAGPQGPPGPAPVGGGVTPGGTTNQVLAKVDGSDFNVHWQTIDKSFVGLANVDNTSDLNKPISTAVTTALISKIDRTGDTMFGVLSMNGNKISNLGTPTLTTDAATKAYVDAATGAAPVWGTTVGTLSDQTDLQDALDTKEPTITASTSSKYWRGDKTFQTLDTSVVPENTNLYYTDARVRLNRLDQLAVPTASLDLNSHKITNLATPTASTDATTKAYVDSVATGLNLKQSCRVATTANITLSGTQTIDGIAVIAGDRVLVKNQTTGADNGIYVADASTWSRATDADTDPEVLSGMFTFIERGSINGNTGWVLTTPNTITVGTTSLSFSQFSGAGTFMAGTGITLTGNTFALDTSYSDPRYINTTGDTMTGLFGVQVTDTSAFNIKDGGGTSVFNTDTSNKRIGIGTTTPIADVDLANKNLLLRGDSTVNPAISLYSSQGTLASPTITTTGRTLSSLAFYGYDGTQYKYAANITVNTPSGATYSSTSMPVNMNFGVNLRKQANSAIIDAVVIGSQKTINLWGGTQVAGDSNFSITQPGGSTFKLPGLVTTNGTTALVGTETLFTNDFKPGDNINVTGETVRIVLSVTDDTHLTVTSAFSTTASNVTYYTDSNVRFRVRGNGQVGIGVTPTAMFHLPAGTANAKTAPLKFTQGINLTTPENGAWEFDGTHFYATIGSTRYQIDQQPGSGTSAWGAISGVLSSQTDLQSVLNTKITRTGDTMTGNLVFSTGLQTQQASYTLFISGSTYKAQNGSTNAIDYSGTNFYTVFNSVLGALTNGGYIFVRAGTYLTPTEINISTSNITIEGEGVSTIFKAANSANVRSVLAVSGTNTVEVKLRKFAVDGNKANQTSGDGIYITGPTSSNCGIVLEDILIQNCKNNGFGMSGNPGTSSMYFTRVHSTTNDGNGFHFPYNLGVALTDSVFDSCIADTNALNGFYLSVLDSHFFGCKSYYNGSAGGNNHGINIAGYNNFFVNCEAQDNYQSGFYSENAGDPTYGSEYCTFVNCTGNNNGQTGGTTYACGLQAINVKGWQIMGGVYNTHPYPSFVQRIGVSLEGTTTLTRVTGIHGENNSDSLYKDTSSGTNYPLHIPGVISKFSDDLQIGTNKINFGSGYINSTDTQNLVLDSGTSHIQFKNFSEVFWNGLNKNISLYNASDNTLGVINAGGGKANLNVQNQLTFGYGEYLGVSPASSWPSGTHKLVEVSYNGTNDQVDFYTPGSQRSTSLLKLTADGKITANVQLDMGTQKIINVLDPTLAQDVATKHYVDTFSDSGFVKSSNAAFHLNGEKFRFVGGNYYPFIVSTSSLSEIRSVLDASKAKGITVLRTWAFDAGKPPANSAGNFRYLDYPIGTNLLSNGDFETNTTGWTLSSDFSRSNDTAETGTFSIKQVSTSGYNNFYASITTATSTNYVLTFWHKTTNNSGLPAVVLIGTTPGNNDIKDGGFISDTAGIWQKSQIFFNSGINTTVYIAFQNFSGSVNAYYDTINVSVQGTPALAFREATYQQLDLLLSEARQRGIKLILSLADNNTNYDTKTTYVNWANAIYGLSLSTAFPQQAFFDDSHCRQLYKDFTDSLMNRVNTINGITYKNDNTIFSWELGNELRYDLFTSEGGTQNTINSTNIIAMTSWINDVAGHIKSVDTNHMIGFGDLNHTWQYATGDTVSNGSGYGVDYNIHSALSVIDYLDFHLYPTQGDGVHLQKYGQRLGFPNSVSGAGFKAQLADYVAVGHANGKPVICTELGFVKETVGDNTYYPLYPRTEAFRNIFKDFFDIPNGGDGILPWSIVPTTGGGTYSINLGDITGNNPDDNANDYFLVNVIEQRNGSFFTNVTTPSLWGGISGTLSTQTDLQNALNTKLNLSGGAMTGALSIASASATSFAVGLNGTTNPAFQVDNSTASSVTGIKVKSNIAGSGVAISALSSQTNENLTISAKGTTGTIGLTGGAIIVTGQVNVTSIGTQAFTVGINSVTNPVFQVDASASSAETGLLLVGNTAGNGVLLGVSSPNSNENLTISPKGTGTITSTGLLKFSGSGHAGLQLNSLTTTQRDALTGVNGNLIYNSTLAQVQKYENSQWVDISKSSATKVVALSGSGHAADYYTPGDTTGVLDAVAIQSAINAVHTLGGGSVYIKAGTYYIFTSLQIYDNTHVYGDGKATYIKYINTTVSTSSILMENQDQVNGNTGIVISDLMVDGNLSNVTVRTPGVNQVYLHLCDNCVVRDITVVNAPHAAIVLDSSTNCIVKNNYVDSCVDIGIYVSNSQYNIVTGNKVSNTGSYGIRCVSQGGGTGTQNLVNGNWVYNCGQTSNVEGIMLESGAEQNNVVGNYVYLSGRAGIYVANSAYALVTGNYVENNDHEGIIIDTVGRAQITGNTVHANSRQTSNTYAGIRLLNVQNVTVTGNRSGDTGSGTRQKYGILEDGTSDFNTITGNMVDRNGTSGLVIVGTHTQVGHNTTVISGTPSESHSGFTSISPIVLLAGVATAGGAPLKLTSGTNLTTPEAGAIEFDGTDLSITDSGSTRRTLLYADFSNGLAGATPTFSSITLTNPLAVGNGGTGQTTYTDGQLLIGNTTGNTLSKATLTAGNNITVTNGHGSITLDTIQNIRTTDSPTFAGLSLGTGALNTVGNIEIDGSAARDMTVAQAASGVGNALTIQAGASQSGISNSTGGALILKSGAGTGNATGSIIAFYTSQNTSSGSGGQTVAERMRILANSGGSVIIGATAQSTGMVADGLTFGGGSAKGVQVNRHPTGNTAGNNMTVQSGGATSGATDKASGHLILSPGLSTGTGIGGVVKIQGLSRATSTSTSDNALTDRALIGVTANIADAGTSLFDVALATLAMAGGTILWTIEASDGTDMQAYSGVTTFSAVNKGGSYTTAITQDANNDAKSVSSGTLTTAWSIVTGTNKVTIKITPTGSLTETTYRINYSVFINCPQAITLL